MPKRPESPAPLHTDIIAGHFNHHKRYSAYRGQGSRDWLIIYTASGRGRFGYGTPGELHGEIIAEPGDIVLLRPGTLHDYGLEQSLKHWELLWAHFLPRPDWHHLLAWPAARDGWRGLMVLRLDNEAARQKIHSRMLDMIRLASGAQRLRSSFAMNALEEVLLWCDANNPKSAEPVDPRIAQVMDYVCGDLKRRADVPHLAEIAGLSESRFAHLFRQSIGSTPQRWVELQRLNRARQLLKLTSMPIKQIAGEVGFESPLYFTLRFAKNAGEESDWIPQRGLSLSALYLVETNVN